MAYDNDVVFVFTGGLTFGELGEKRIKNCSLWFGIEANLKKEFLRVKKILLNQLLQLRLLQDTRTF